MKPKVCLQFLLYRTPGDINLPNLSIDIMRRDLLDSAGLALEYRITLLVIWSYFRHPIDLKRLIRLRQSFFC